MEWTGGCDGKTGTMCREDKRVHGVEDNFARGKDGRRVAGCRFRGWPLRGRWGGFKDSEHMRWCGALLGFKSDSNRVGEISLIRRCLYGNKRLQKPSSDCQQSEGKTEKSDVLSTSPLNALTNESRVDTCEVRMDGAQLF